MKVEAEFEMSGFEKDLQRLIGGTRKEGKRALREVGEEDLSNPGKMKDRTPVKSGALVRSERATVYEKSDEMGVQWSAGNEATDYAVHVHENLKARHPNGGQAKFIESVVVEETPRYPQRLADIIDLNRALKG